MSSVIEKNTITITDTSIAKLYKAPMLNPGSLFLLDLTNAESNPTADGAIADNAVFKNLVNGGPDAKKLAQVSGTAYAVSNAAGKTGVTTGGSVSNLGSPPRIEFDAAIDTGQNPIMQSLWMKPDAVAPFVANSFIFGDKNADTSFRKLAVYAGIAGRAPQGIQRRSGSTYSTNAPADNAYNGLVTHIAITWVAGVQSLWFNGALFHSVAGIPDGTMDTTTGKGPGLEFHKGGKYYQWYGERLDLSGKTAAQAVADDFAFNDERFA